MVETCIVSDEDVAGGVGVRNIFPFGSMSRLSSGAG